MKALRNIAILLLGTLVAGCIARFGDDDRPWWQMERPVSPAAAEAAAERVVNPSDIPRGFTDCVGGHSADARYHEDETGPSYSVDKTYSRSCPDIILNRPAQPTVTSQ